MKSSVVLRSRFSAIYSVGHSICIFQKLKAERMPPLCHISNSHNVVTSNRAAAGTRIPVGYPGNL